MGRKLTFIIALLAILSACHNTASDVGAGLVTAQQFDISFVDTLSVRTSTVKYDSLVTSGGARLLVGYHDDPKMGPVMAKTALQISTPSFVSISASNTHYVGLYLELYRDSYYYYDTTQTQTINVHQITELQQLYNGVRYNVDPLHVDPTPLGSLTFSPRPNLKDSLQIPLSDDLGKQWFLMAQQNDPNFLPENFAKTFFGLALIPDSTQSRNFLGFVTKATKILKAPEVRLYYTDDTTPAGYDPLHYISFIIGAQDFYWTKFTGDRSATKLAPIKLATDILPSSATDNEIYCQGGTGVAMRLEFPYLKDLNFIQPNFQCTKALLTMTPIRSSSDPQNPPPKTISLDLVDPQNLSLAPNYLSGSLFTDQYGVQTYTVDLTSFVNGEINTTTNNVNNGLLVRLSNSDVNSTVNRLYVGDQRNYYLMKLKVYYITLTDENNGH